MREENDQLCEQVDQRKDRVTVQSIERGKRGEATSTQSEVGEDKTARQEGISLSVWCIRLGVVVGCTVFDH